MLVADPALYFSVLPPAQLTPITTYLSVPTLTSLLPRLLDSVTKTASHSFSVGFARGTLFGLWNQLRQDIVVSLKRAVLDPSPLNIFQATVDLLFGPARLLDNSKTQDVKLVYSPPTRLQQVQKKLKNGHVSKAFAILTGNGVAEHTSDQLLRTESLFPTPLLPPSFTPTTEVLDHRDSSAISAQFTKFLLSEDPAQVTSLVGIQFFSVIPLLRLTLFLLSPTSLLRLSVGIMPRLSVPSFLVPAL